MKIWEVVRDGDKVAWVYLYRGGPDHDKWFIGMTFASGAPGMESRPYHSEAAGERGATAIVEALAPGTSDREPDYGDPEPEHDERACVLPDPDQYYKEQLENAEGQ
jgi:hypothetical protein